MSVGMNKSYQCVGLNRLGAYLSVAKTKGPVADRTGKGESGGSGDEGSERPNEIWRRVTGIYPDVKQTAKQRKRGLRILARRIQERVSRESSQVEAAAADSIQGFSPEPEAGCPSHLRPLSYRGTGDGARLSLADDWTVMPDSWVRTREGGVTIEAVCVELGCSRALLNSLIKEYCGLSAEEFFDGLKFSRLKAALLARLRAAAEELWGYPGSYIAVKLSLLSEAGSTLHDGSGYGGNRGRGEYGGQDGNGGLRRAKDSRFFRSRAEELFEETRGEERARRIGELCERLRAGFDLDGWAAGAGYASGTRLKRACLNVAGRSLREIERLLAAEVVQFYFCAEDRELRELACADGVNATVARARELYHASEDKPEAPYEDEWSKFEELKAEWLSRLKAALTS